MSYIKQLQNGLVTLLQDKDVYLIGEDITEPYGGSFKVSKGLSLEFPNQVIATPMSEQGFTGMGIGMALAGLKVIVEIMFGDFITLCADQMINHASKFVGLYDKKFTLSYALLWVDTEVMEELILNLWKSFLWVIQIFGL